MKKIRVLAAILAVLLTGCSSAASLDHRAYAVLAGLEHSEDGRYLVSVRLNDITTEESDPENGNFIAVNADTPAMAAALLSVSGNQSVAFSQLHYLVFSEELAKSDDFMPLVRELSANPAINPSAGILITPDSPARVLQAIRPLLGERLGRALATLETTLIDRALLPSTSLHRLATLLGSGYQTPLGGVCAQNADTQPDEKTDGQENAPDGTAADTRSETESSPKTVSPPADLPDAQGIAGTNARAFAVYADALSHAGGNPVDLLGAAVFSADRLSRLLTGYETQLLGMVMGNFKSADLVLATADGPVDLKIERVRRVIPPSPVWTEDPYLAVSLKIEGEASVFTQEEAAQIARNAARSLENDLYRLLTALYADGCDPLGLCGQTAKDYPAVSVWESAEIPSRIKTMPWAVSVEAVFHARNGP